MTRKDYVAVAKILHEAHDSVDTNAWLKLVASFSEFFENDNERFDHARFFSACYGLDKPVLSEKL